MKNDILEGDLSLKIKAKCKIETNNLPESIEKSLIEEPNHEIIVKTRLESANN